MTDTPAIPPAHTFVWTVVESLRALGGSGRNEEINEEAVKLRGLTEAQQLLPSSKRNQTEVEYRLSWARTIAKMAGLLDNSDRGVWALTELGQTVTEQQVDQLKAERRSQRAAARRARRREELSAGEDTSRDDLDEEAELQDWKEQLLDVMKGMSPDGFERLAKRLLREAGFVNVTVTGGSGDGGIDGSGVYRMSLVSFPVYFQCKRYAGPVGSSKVRDFRGAMVGRGEKGLLITTGTFTSDAQAEATRDGAPPIDLIDGGDLAELLKRYQLGVTTVTRTVEDVTVDPGFFAGV